MKKQLIFLLIPVFLFACNNGNVIPDAYGNFEAEEIFIASETPGKVISLHVNEGDEITKGSVLAIIDTTQLFLQKKQLEASIISLRQKLQNVPVQLGALVEQEQVLEKEVRRIGNLLDAGAATQKTYDDLIGQMEVVRKQKQALESQLSTANRSILSEVAPVEWRLRQVEDLIEKSQVLSPINGTVLSKYRAQGEIVQPGLPMLKVASLKNMTLRIYVSGDQLSQVNIGNGVNIRIDGSDGNWMTFDGTISWVASKAEFTPKTIQTRTERVNQVYAVKVDVPNDGTIKIGMPAEVLF